MSPTDLRRYATLSFAQGTARMLLDDVKERFPNDKDIRGKLSRLEAACIDAKLFYPNPTPDETEAGKKMMLDFFPAVGWGGVEGQEPQKKHPQTYLSFAASILGDEARSSMSSEGRTKPNGHEKRLLRAEAIAGEAALAFKENLFCLKAASRAADIWAKKRAEAI